MRQDPFAPTPSVAMSIDVPPPPPHGGSLPPPHPGPQRPAAGGPPASGAPPSGYPPTGYPLMHGEPPRRSKKVGWIVLAALAGVIALVGAIVAISSNESSTTTTSPGAAATVQPTVTLPGSATTGESTITEPASTVANDLLQGPVDVLDSFAFTEAVSIAWAGGGMTMNVSGSYVAGDQQCALTVSMGGMTVTTSAVVIGDQAWYDPGDGHFVATTPDDTNVTSVLPACPSSHEMWGEDFEPAPAGGVDATLDGLPVVQYDVTADVGTWGQFVGLPAGMTAQSMLVFASQDRTWVAGMQATVIGSADTFRSFMGVPPSDVTGDCTMTLDLRIQRPNDATLTVVAPA